MPRPRRIAYFVVEANVSENAKLAALPSDEARLGYFYACLGRGKLQRPQGRFASRSHWRDVAGRFARYLPKYVAVGVMHEAPLTCADCRKDWPDAQPGQLFVHNFLRHQIDPWAAERAEEWRSSNADRTANERGSNDDRTMSSGARAPRARDARSARVSGRVSAPHVETVRHRDNETESPLVGSEEDRSSSRATERSDVAALLARGWRRVTPSQRAVLDEVLEHHDMTGPEWAAAIIRRTPADEDPLAAVMGEQARWMRAERDRADREDTAWQATKADERTAAAAAYDELFGATR